jgi:hypothetical protein
METSCSVQYWELQEVAVLQFIRITGEHLRRFVSLYGIQNFVDVFILNLAMN